MTKNFCTAIDNQTEMSIRIYEGEDPVASKNHLLGNFNLRGIPPAPSETEQVLDTWQIDENGILSVTATVVSTQGQKSLTIEKEKYCLGKQTL
jgi:molecular chaperone DnaK (HSP70)